jgi:ABC-type glycerol-3-phosphate transport system permease component
MHMAATEAPRPDRAIAGENRFSQSQRAGARFLQVFVLYALLAAICLFVLMPIGWMLTAALKPDTAPIFTFPPEWFPTDFWHWQTFKEALLNPDRPFLRYALNSGLISGMAIVGSVMSCSMIAYPFARLRFRGRDKLFGLVLATMLLPGPVLIIPQFLLFYRIGWYGTYLPLIVPWFTGNAFFIFLLRQYMRTIPKDLDEAARVDGAGYWEVYWRIILPLTAPALTVVAVFAFLWTWNDFFGPLLYLDDQDKFTVALALATFVRRVGTEWNEMMAANLMSILPVLVIYFLAQNKLIGGIASVGIKG